ncbi:hypothetical protein GCM10010172_81670 [Paractinoplanes ferrugineus]|uniref:Uncharacterized protein n=1 Tax=Paractinoplanes ferrugineus TaxID=113564 RepID=A0A919MC85_9ACTN|nr:hypothetical protein Afe05nite_23280 [Actinoplanes ferrugineus]
MQNHAVSLLSQQLTGQEAETLTGSGDEYACHEDQLAPWERSHTVTWTITGFLQEETRCVR